ncbi:MAG: FKBP-type peptidyl-prolyl cis-trans isomerase [Pseudomonadota bacterium]|nr:FKBP-type peptidyl-prolyl cis-trans isomerase [Pseudomonadota bacterium]
MVRRIVLASVAILLLAGLAVGKPKTVKERNSYALAVRMVQNLVGQGMELDGKAFVAGVEDTLAKKLQMTEDEIAATLKALHKKTSEEMAKKMQELAEQNKKEGEKFLASNAKLAGVTSLDSGLQYKILTKGTGKMPKETDRVETHYVGTLINGKEFDSSRKRGKPAVFPVNGVIKGWTEALTRMPVGSKWMLYVPSHLAYGERGAGQDIGPNATLIFEVELLAIK